MTINIDDLKREVFKHFYPHGVYMPETNPSVSLTETIDYLASRGYLATQHPADAVEGNEKPVNSKVLKLFDDCFENFEYREYAHGEDSEKAEGRLYFFWPEQEAEIRSALTAQKQGWMPITAHIDDQETYLNMAINNIKFGNKTDDKLIIAELHKLGYTIAKLPPPPQKGD